MAQFRMDDSLYARIWRYIEENWVGESSPEQDMHFYSSLDRPPAREEELEEFAARWDALDDLDISFDVEPDADFDIDDKPCMIEAPEPEPAFPPVTAAAPRPEPEEAGPDFEKRAKKDARFHIRKLRRRAKPAKQEPVFGASRPEIMGLHIAEEEEACYSAPMASPAPAPAAGGGFDPYGQDFPLEESFSQAVLRLIDEKGMTDPQCYNRANLSRAVFNKLKQSALNPEGSEYKPSKETALALTIGLALTLDEAKKLLEKAGFAFSRCSKRDLIVEYFLLYGNHDIFELNEALFRFREQPLGSF